MPYRTVYNDLTEGNTYWTTIEYDTTQQGKHALDYLTTYDRSFPAARNETTPDPLLATSGLLTTATSTLAIPLDPKVQAGQDGILGTSDDITQVSGQFTFYGGATNLSYVLPGADGTVGTLDDLVYRPGADGLWGTGDERTVTPGADNKWGTSDDVLSAPTNISGSTFYSVSGSYAGTSKTSLTVMYTYTGNGGSAGTTGTGVLAWGGHVASQVDWGSGNAASGISGSPYHMRLTNFRDNDPTTSESVGQQDRSLASAAILSPSLNVTKTVTDVGGDGASGSADQAGDVITYEIAVANTGNQTLTGLVVSDAVEAYASTSPTFVSGDTDSDGSLDVGETWIYSSSYTVTQDDIDNNGGGDGTIDNVATADSDQTGEDTDTASVPLVQAPALDITKMVTDVGGDGASGTVDAAGDVISYDIKVENTGNQTLTGLVVSDAVESYASTSPTFVSGDTDSDGNLDVGETWVYSSSYTVTQADLDNNGGGDGTIDNVATADSDQTSEDTSSATTVISQSASIDVEKLVSVDGGTTYVDADAAPGPTLVSGDPMFRFDVTNTGNVSLLNVVVTDDNGTPGDTSDDFNVTLTGLADLDSDGNADDLAVGATATGTVTGTFQSGQQTDTASASGDGAGGTATDTDAANYFGFVPVVVTGSPQFNFPNDVDKIQPKLQGGSFTLNSNAYISWDLFTSNTDLAQIDLDPSTYGSSYAGLTVSIVKIYEDAGTKDAIYRVYVANESGSAVSLADNTNIVDYDVIQADGTPVLSTNKGLIDLVNSDPLIGNFNNFNNIENALDSSKDATNGFLTAPTPPLTAGADKVWGSSNETGTATNETAVTYDGLGGNDAIYGTNNSASASDSLSGGLGNDMIEGRAGPDTINGGDGNDFLFGSLGDDILIGGAGDDRLFGGYGADNLTGGTGADDFIIRKGDFEVINDFNTAQGDQIWVWVDTLDSTGASSPPTVTYDQPSGTLFVDGDAVAQLVGNPVITTIGTNPTNEVFIT